MKSAWEERRRIYKEYGSDYVNDILYSWFASTEKTISTNSAGLYLLISLPEEEALKVLAQTEIFLKEGKKPYSGVWDDFLKEQEDKQGFSDHLTKATKIVNDWPEWKKNSLT